MKFAAPMLIITALTLTACAAEKKQEYVELDKHFSLIDAEGRQAGTVMLRPIGKGEIRDNSGSLIGVIEAPDNR